ncbi:5-dehydro-4-deoxy-D-glucuronate isomerase [Microbacterium aurum]
MSFETRYAHSPAAVAGMDTAALRDAFVASALFTPGEVNGIYTHHDRIVAFGVVPTDTALTLPTPDEVRADFLLQRREAGVLNLGGSGVMIADGVEYPLARVEAAYVGRGTREVSFRSDDASDPAAFYVFTAAAHVAHPTVRIPQDAMRHIDIGDAERASFRTLHQCILEDLVPSANIAFGYTTVHPGNVWNTMPPHTHDRRTECYLYFDLADDDRVFHILGEPDQTRHVVLADRDFVISPSWSVHFGASTGPYSFVWATAGENAAYGDMDAVAVESLR